MNVNGMNNVGSDSKKRISVVSGETEQHTMAGGYRTPRIAILESSTEFIVKAEVPGSSTDDVDVKYEHGKLTLEARRRPIDTERSPAVLRGRDLSHYRRTFTVGRGIDAENMRAVLGNDGMLVMHLPKRQEHAVRTVKINES